MSTWDETTRDKVWEKAHPDPAYNPNFIRRDDYRNLICKDCYGKWWDDLGWEIDHIIPDVSRWSSDCLWNLRPLQCSANRSRQANLDLDELLQAIRRSPVGGSNWAESDRKWSDPTHPSSGGWSSPYSTDGRWRT